MRIAVYHANARNLFWIAFQMKNAQSYQIATTSLDMEQQTFLMELMRRATESNSGGKPPA
jgi:hypothetical protein